MNGCRRNVDEVIVLEEPALVDSSRVYLEVCEHQVRVDNVLGRSDGEDLPVLLPLPHYAAVGGGP